MKKSLTIALIVFSVICLFIASLSIYVLLDRGFVSCVHSQLSKNVLSPTCTKEGYTSYTCTKCSYSYVGDVIPPNGHTLNKTTVPPSCESEGYTLYFCSCGYSYTSDKTPPNEHHLKSSEIAPTCTEQGYFSYYCSLCDYSFKSDFTEPTGHEFVPKTFLPTATRAGYTEYTCHCSYSYIGDRVYYSDILESAYTKNTQVIHKGLDVSRWNHSIDVVTGEYMPLDWELIKASGFDFVIIKAGSTRSGLEPTFEDDYSRAKAAGLEVGAYFYTYSYTREGILKDAEALMTWLKGKQFEYPIYLDIEDSSLEDLGKNHLSDMCTAFLEKLQENGYYVGLYTNHKWLTTILDTAKMVSLFDIWYARYPSTTMPTWNEEKYGKQLGMWQYTQSGRIDGIDSDFDFNYVYKDYSALMQEWNLNGF